MPECSQTPRRQRPDYLADFTSASSSNNTCSSSDEEEEEERRKPEQTRGGEKREKKVSYDLGESKDKNLAERSGKVAAFNSRPFSRSLYYLLGVLFTLCIFLYLDVMIFSYIRSAWFDFWDFVFPCFSLSTLHNFFVYTASHWASSCLNCSPLKNFNVFILSCCAKFMVQFFSYSFFPRSVGYRSVLHVNTFNNNNNNQT